MEESKNSKASAKRFESCKDDCPEPKRKRLDEKCMAKVDERKFTSINDIRTKMKLQTRVSFMGIVVEAGEITSQLVQNGRKVPMRKVLLMDNADDTIFLTIWGSEIVSTPIEVNCRLHVKLATIITFNDERLLTAPRSMVSIVEHVPEAVSRFESLPKKTSPVASRPIVGNTSRNVFYKSRFTTYKFVSIAEIETRIPVETRVDFIGLVVRVGEQFPGNSKSGVLMVREVTMTDRTGLQIVVPIYSKEFDDTEILPNFVLYLKAATVVNFEGKKRLSVVRFNVWVNPEESDVPEVRALKESIETSVSTPKTKYTRIAAILDKVPPRETVNVLGVVINYTSLGTKVVNNKTYMALEVTLLDQSGRQIAMTIRGPTAGLLATTASERTIVAGFEVSVVDSEGTKKLLSSKASSTIVIEPDVDEKRALRHWFENVWLEANRENGSVSTTPPVVKVDERENLGDSLRSATFTPIFVVYETVPVDSKIHVLVVVHELGPLHIIEHTDGSTSYDRIVTVVDDSRKSIPLRIMDARARSIERGATIAAKNVRVSSKKILVPSTDDSSFLVDPPLDKARALKEWYKINAVDKPFVEKMLPITSNSDTIKKFEDGDQTSILGILKKIHDLNPVKKPDDSPVANIVDSWRTIELVDQTEVTIGVILWSDQAKNFDFAVGSILLVTNVRVSTLQGFKCFTCSELSNITARFTEPNVVEFVDRLQIWSNVRTLRHLREEPAQPTFNDVEAVAAAMNNTMSIFKSEARGSHFQGRIKADPAECPDSGTRKSLGAEREAAPTSKSDEENETMEKIGSKKNLDGETFLDSQRNGAPTSQPNEKEKRTINVEPESLNYEAFLDSQRNSVPTLRQDDKERRTVNIEPESLDDETFLDSQINRVGTLQPNEKEKRAIKVEPESLDDETFLDS